METTTMGFSWSFCLKFSGFATLSRFRNIPAEDGCKDCCRPEDTGLLLRLFNYVTMVRIPNVVT